MRVSGMGGLTDYQDGIAPLVERPEPVCLCPTCHEPRPDLSMPCEWCGEVE